MADHWTVGARVAEELQKIAAQLDSEAATVTQPGQMLALEGIAAKLRVLATTESVPAPQCPDRPEEG